jgi:hypothetical protein
MNHDHHTNLKDQCLAYKATQRHTARVERPHEFCQTFSLTF